MMHKLATELAAGNFQVVLTSTTKFQVESGVDVILQDGTPDYLSAVDHFLGTKRMVAVASEASPDDKARLIGVNRQTIAELRRRADVVLIEADGSRQRPLKTHRHYEPVIPPECDSVIIICGADAIGQPLDEKFVHRAKLFAEKWELPIGTTMTPDIAARELLSPYSYLKNIPLHSNICYYVNKADKNPIGARLLAENIKRRCDYAVFYGSLKKNKLQRIMLNSTRS